MMNEIWSIIGLSSLIASIVTIILGIVRDVLVEKYRFKREKEAGYIQNQIRMHSQIYLLLKRLRKGATAPEYFGEVTENIRELNDIIKKSSDVLKPIVLNEWLALFTTLKKIMEEKPKSEKRKELVKEAKEHSRKLVLTIKNTMNKDLIPKYRKIVGETVPALGNTEVNTEQRRQYGWNLFYIFLGLLLGMIGNLWASYFMKVLEIRQYSAEVWIYSFIGVTIALIVFGFLFLRHVLSLIRK